VVEVVNKGCVGLVKNGEILQFLFENVVIWAAIEELDDADAILEEPLGEEAVLGILGFTVLPP